jgi:PEP-CTERM motif
VSLRNCVIGLSALLIAVLPGKTEAATITYTNLAAFQTAAGLTTLENFASSTPFNTTGAFGPTSYAGFSLTGNGNGNNIGVHSGAVTSDNTPIPASFTGQQFFGFGNAAGGVISPIVFTFASPITAFGFDWFNTDVTDQYTLSINGINYSGPPFTVTTSSTATSGFFGVVSDTPFSTASIFNQFNGGFISDEGFDNVRTSAAATAATVPEPSTLVLVLGGLVGTLRVARRYRS